MNFKLNLLLLLTIHQIVCNQPKNMEELENSEDWEGIHDQICKHNHSNDIRKQIEKCHIDNDPHYKFDVMTKLFFKFIFRINLFLRVIQDNATN